MKNILLMGLLFLQIQFSDCAADVEIDSGSGHPAINFIVPERADMMAKYIYAKHREWGVSDIFAVHLYYAHLRVWNGFWERTPVKRSFEDFVSGFDHLLDSIKNENFSSDLSSVLLDPTGRVRDGAHRVAACVLYNKPVFVKEIADVCPNWDLAFFEHKGVIEKHVDAMAIQYCELKPNTYVMVIFPAGGGHQEQVDKTITKFAKIVHKKRVFLNANGGLNLILHAYDKEPFICDNEKINYDNARAKAQACFPTELTATNPVRVYLLESDSIDKMKACKAEIRNIFNIGNHSVHITDTHEQAQVLSKALFNKNSIHCLRHRKNIELYNAAEYFGKYKNWIELSEYDSEWFCLDSEAVLAVYGLRDCHDWEYLHFDESTSYCGIPGIRSHNKALAYHRWDKERILFDPDYYFYYKGIKCCALQVVRAMKEKRQQLRDLYDIALIDGS